MQEGIGEWFTINIIIIFIVIVFGLLTATLSYYKAFKVNSDILYNIEKFEGYNDKSKQEIDNYLSSIGYKQESIECAETRSNMQLSQINSQQNNYAYCVYYTGNDGKDNSSNYYNYAVLTYIYVDLPLIDLFKIPVYTKGERIYKFTEN